MQNKEILQRFMPDGLKLEIAKKIENHLFSKVPFLYACQAKASNWDFDGRFVLCVDLMVLVRWRHYLQLRYLSFFFNPFHHCSSSFIRRNSSRSLRSFIKCLSRISAWYWSWTLPKEAFIWFSARCCLALNLLWISTAHPAKWNTILFQRKFHCRFPQGS